MNEPQPLVLGELLEALRNPFFGEEVADRPSPIVVVDLDELTLQLSDDDHSLLGERLPALRAVTVGLVRGEVDPRLSDALARFDVLLAPAEAAGLALVPSASLGDDVALLTEAVGQNPLAAVALAEVLRLEVQADVARGLIAESMTYSMLQAGPEFAAWLAGRSRRPMPVEADPVLVQRTEGTVTVTLNRPARANAYSHTMRDALVESLRTAWLDPSVAGVILRGAGNSFCSGGDLDEFGTTPDPAQGHAIRLRRSAGWWLHLLGGRVRSHLHGACVGAGIELPSFGGTVIASPDTIVRLPEVAMGLIPGAGGTVSLTNRIGRHRTAYLGLTGRALDAPEARRWGLIDRIS